MQKNWFLIGYLLTWKNFNTSTRVTNYYAI